jgi:hypothetical protein
MLIDAGGGGGAIWAKDLLHIKKTGFVYSFLPKLTANLLENSAGN